MKARVKATGDIIDIAEYSTIWQLLGGMITKVINAIIPLGRCTDY